MVAFVPTPIQDATCVPAGKDCVPLPLVEGVGLNVGAYLTLGLVALGYLWLRRLLEGRERGVGRADDPGCGGAHCVSGC